MTQKILVISPHPDDESIGCGGTLLRHRFEGHETHWVIVTCMHESVGYNKEQIKKRQSEIKEVAKQFEFKSVTELKIPTTTCDQIPMRELTEKIAAAVRATKPDTLYVPFPHDVHSDHRAIGVAIENVIKPFRAEYLRRVLSYEVLSETDQSRLQQFKPQFFVDISNHIDQKISICKLYQSELGNHPFPRNEKAIRALATVRGASAGFHDAEAFQVLLDRW